MHTGKLEPSELVPLVCSLHGSKGLDVEIPCWTGGGKSGDVETRRSLAVGLDTTSGASDGNAGKNVAGSKGEQRSCKC